MENTTKEEKVTVTREVVRSPAEVGTAIVDEVDTVGHEVAKFVADGTTVLVGATKTAVSDIATAAKQLGLDVEHVFSPPSEPLKTSTAPTAVAPIAVAPVAAATEA